MRKLAFIQTGVEKNGTIVAFHGVTDSAASMPDLATHFKEDWRVILVDSLGHGLSPRFTDEELEAPFEAAVKAATETLTQIAADSFGRSVILFGHSMGGAVACAVAVRYPQLVRGLVLEDPALLTPAQSKKYRESVDDLAAWPESMRKKISNEIARLQAEYPNWTAQEIAGWAQAKIQSDERFLKCGVVGILGREILAKIQVPTLLVTGDGADVLWGADGLKEVAEIGNANVQRKLILGASHTVRRDAPVEFFTAVDEFIENLPQAQPSWPSKVKLRAELAQTLSQIPAQSTWNIMEMREVGDELLNCEVVLPANISRKIYSLNGVEVRKFENTTSHSPQRILFAVHGGGYVAGKATYDDSRNIEIISELPDSFLFTPEYRLAPEFPYPAAVEDCKAALAGVMEEYPNLPIFFYGDSAGCGIINQILQDSEIAAEERIKGFIALEPCLSPRMDTLSYCTYRDGPVWSEKAAKYAWQYYASAEDSQKICAVDLESVAKYPRMLIVVNAADPLRDEGINWGMQLTDAGVPVDLHLFAGTYHGALSVPNTNIWHTVKETIRHFLADN